MLLTPPVVDVTSVVVTFKNLVVGDVVVVETASNPFVFSLGRSGAAKEDERGRRNKASINIILLFSTFVAIFRIRTFTLLLS